MKKYLDWLRNRTSRIYTILFLAIMIFSVLMYFLAGAGFYLVLVFVLVLVITANVLSLIL
jgi:hypothetical protein